MAKRLRHFNRDKFLELRQHGMVSDLSFIEEIKSNDHIWEACIKGHQFRLPSRKSKDRTYVNRPLLNIH